MGVGWGVGWVLGWVLGWMLGWMLGWGRVGARVGVGRGSAPTWTASLASEVRARCAKICMISIVRSITCTWLSLRPNA